MRIYLNFSDWLMNEASREMSWFRKQSEGRQEELKRQYERYTERLEEFKKFLSGMDVTMDDYFNLSVDERKEYFKQFEGV